MQLKFSKIRYGWINIFFMRKEHILFHAHGSDVYDPLYELPDIVIAIKNMKSYIWEIDEEGSLEYVKFSSDKAGKYKIVFITRDEVESSITINRTKLIRVFEKGMKSCFVKIKRAKESDFYIDKKMMDAALSEKIKT